LNNIFNISISNWIGTRVIITLENLGGDRINSYIGKIISYYVKEGDISDRYIWMFEVETSNKIRVLVEEKYLALEEENR